MKERLRVADLWKTYPSPSEELTVLRDLNVELEAGQSLAVTGPSGCGKSTLLHILGTLERPSRGTVELAGTCPFELPERELAAFRNEKVGFVFQDHHLLPQCTVLENVLVPTVVARGVTGDVLEWGRVLIARVGLEERMDHVPSQLSGGERQRVAIARALIHKPPLLLCDEPTGNLDEVSARVVGDLFLELHRQVQNILVVVTHSRELASRFQREMSLREGCLVPGGEGPS